MPYAEREKSQATPHRSGTSGVCVVHCLLCFAQMKFNWENAEVVSARLEESDAPLHRENYHSSLSINPYQ